MSGPRPNRVKWSDHQCPICGVVVRLTGKDRNYRGLVGCGKKACTSALLARAAESKLKLHDRPREWEATRKIAHRESPRSGPYETNATAKDYRLIAPDGSRHSFRNLSKFVRDHADLFEGDDLKTTSKFGPRAVSALGKLRPERRERKISWKGWEWDFSANAESSNRAERG